MCTVSGTRRGSIGLQYCSVTVDGVHCAVDYNCVHWGAHELSPQAGIGVFERGPDGLLTAVRVYDGIEAPASMSRPATYTVTGSAVDRGMPAASYTSCSSSLSCSSRRSTMRSSRSRLSRSSRRASA